jgi:2,5-diamino-6-(ribosylamino)-4(3H)-pyrimidinone 5'-phosphate reductase
MVANKRPYVTINCAISIDGKLGYREERLQISSDQDLRRVHKLRAECDAIVVGVNTIITDNPSLKIKREYYKSNKKPTRIVLDSMLRIPRNAKVLDGTAPTIIAVSERCSNEKINEIRNATIIKCGTSSRVDILELLKRLHEMNIRKILVEGGGTVIGSFLNANVVDELKIYIGNVLIGCTAPMIMSSVRLGHINLELGKVTRIDKNSVLLEYKVT